MQPLELPGRSCDDLSSVAVPADSSVGLAERELGERARIVFQGIATPCSTTGWCTV